MSRTKAYAARERRGNVAVLVAACVVPLLGIAALAIDGGYLLLDRRKGCDVADSAAIAAAVDLFNNYPTNDGVDQGGTAKASALTTAAANGYNNDGTTTSVTVNIPPASGTFAGNTGGYVEVLITRYQNRFFSSIWGSGSIPVTSRSVARGQWTAAVPAILLLNPNGKADLDVTGSANVIVNGGGSILINSSNSDAGVTTGSGYVQANNFYITGVPGFSGNFRGTVHNGVPPTPDPLANLPVPAAPAASSTSSPNGLSITGSTSLTLQPGTYPKGIKITGSASVTLSPGMYYLQGGGFSITGSGNATGSGVMIYNAPTSTSDTISLTGSGSLTLTPPTSGPYQGIVLFQDRTSSAPVSITGSGSTTITGTFYAAAAKVSVTGSGSMTTIGSQYICYDMAVTGSGGVSVQYSAAAPVRNIQLVE